MKYLDAVLLMSDNAGQRTLNLARQAGIDLNATIVSDLNSLKEAFAEDRGLLLSYGTSVIVPAWILRTPNLLSLNVHAASPQYPGRDPHHFAIYDCATQYGATLHFMTESVDAGPIVDFKLFDIPPTLSPKELLDLATDASFLLIEHFFQKYAQFGAPKAIEGVSWGPRKSTRAMFLELCRIDPFMSKTEIERRYRATAMPGFSNLFVNIQGLKFSIKEQEI